MQTMTYQKSLIAQVNVSHASHYAMHILNLYARTICLYIEEDYCALAGAAIDMRKSLEVMGAFMLKHGNEGSMSTIDIAEGATIRPKLHSVKSESISTFSRYYGSICDGEHGINQILHYQSYRIVPKKPDPSLDWDALLNEDEQKQILNEHQLVRDAIRLFCDTLRFFIHTNKVLQGQYYRCESQYPSLKKLVDISAQNKEIAFSHDICQIAMEIVRYFQKGSELHENAAPDPWLSWYCAILSKYEKDAYSDPSKSSTMVTLLRKMAERVLFRLVCSKGVEKAQLVIASCNKAANSKQDGDRENATLEAYIHGARKLKNQTEFDDPEFSKRCGEIAVAVSLLQIDSNAYLHWYDGQPVVTNEKEKRRTQGVLETLFTKGSVMIGRYVQEKNPIYVWNWIDYHQSKWSQLSDELKAAEEKISELEEQIEKETKKRCLWKVVSTSLMCLVTAFCVGGSLWLQATTGTIRYDVELNGKKLKPGMTYIVAGGEQLRFQASSWDVDVSIMGYYFDHSEVEEISDSVMYFTIPVKRNGDTAELYVAASGRKQKAIIEGKWQGYSFVYQNERDDVEENANSAVKPTPQIAMSISFAGETLQDDHVIMVKAGDIINVNAEAPAGVAFIGFYFDHNNERSPIVDYPGDTAAFVCPPNPLGTDIELYVEAVSNDDDGSPNLITKTGWHRVVLRYQENESYVSTVYDPDLFDRITAAIPDADIAEGVKAVLVDRSTTLLNQSKTYLLGNERINLSALVPEQTEEMYFAWDQEAGHVIHNALSYDIKYPEAFDIEEEHFLYTRAKLITGELTDTQVFRFVLIDATPTTMQVDLNGVVLQEDIVVLVKAGDRIRAKAASKAGIAFVGYYYYVNGVKSEHVDEYDDSISFVCPEMPTDTKLYLFIEAVGQNDKGFPNVITKTGWRRFVLQYK